MENIIRSASKLVLLFLVGVLGVLAMVAGGHGVVAGTFNEAEKLILTTFAGAITFVFGFYFGYKGEEKPAPRTEAGREEHREDVPRSPYAGK